MQMSYSNLCKILYRATSTHRLNKKKKFVVTNEESSHSEIFTFQDFLWCAFLSLSVSRKSTISLERVCFQMIEASDAMWQDLAGRTRNLETCTCCSCAVL